MIRRHYVEGRTDYIELPPLFRWLERTKQVSEICISDLRIKEGELDQARVEKADTKYPLIAVDGLDNKGKKYRLIDGRHRLQKLIRENKRVCDCYILTASEYRSMITTGE